MRNFIRFTMVGVCIASAADIVGLIDMPIYQKIMMFTGSFITLCVGLAVKRRGI